MSEHEKLAPALVAALADLTNVAKAHEGGGGGKTYTYANIADLIAETRPVLAAHGIVALTPVHDHGDGLGCTVVLLHRSGDRLDFGPFPFPHGKDAQSTGSWVTYIRRYSLLAALGMGAEDDDGAKAQPRQQRQERVPEPVSGLTAKEAGDRVRAELERTCGLSDDELTNHAKQVWRTVAPKAVGGIVPDAEVDRLVAEATRHGQDLEDLARAEAHS